MARAHKLAATRLLRWTTLFCTAALSILAGIYVLGFTGADGISVLDLARSLLVTVTGFWLLWGAVPALLGILALPSRKRDRDEGRPRRPTIVLMPIYNEDTDAVFSRVAAMNRGLVRLGLADSFHFAILSDSNDPVVAGREATAFERLMGEPGSSGRLFYRRRENNVGKKAGNIEDFIRHSGGAYAYAIILDADSLMEPETMAAMARRLDCESDLALLQSVPKIIGARTLFGRTIQFASNYLSPTIARGAALLQGTEGPYWGHNAIIRLPAFAASCGLPTLSGAPPHGGLILSHDYVEAALLSREGWRVEVDAGLRGSYEEGPENLIEFAKRDRRWCQGNLQHRRLVFAPRLRPWSRFTLVQGIMAYFASPLWLALLVVSVVAAAGPGGARFANPGLPESSGLGLAIAVGVLLVLPKLLIVARGAIDGENARFGGNLRVLAGMMMEIFYSTLLAPLLLLFQSRAVFQCLFGLDGGWPATQRDSARVPFAAAFAATWWIVLAGVMTLGMVWTFALRTLPWILPVTVPAILAPLIVWASALPAGRRKPLVLITPAERAPGPVIVEQAAILSAWRGGVHRAASTARDDVETGYGPVLA